MDETRRQAACAGLDGDDGQPAGSVRPGAAVVPAAPDVARLVAGSEPTERPVPRPVA